MASEKFRRQLRQEAEHWWKDQLIDTALYEKLAARYQFASLEGEASHRFLAILLGLGSILLGLGIITFIAANWQGWGRWVKVSLLLGGLIGIDTLGFYLWRSAGSSLAAESRRRWGHALLILGTFVLGANLGLLPQMFHQGGPVSALLLLWGICVLLMAYGLRLTSLGVIALVLLLCGYFADLGNSFGTGSDLDFWAGICEVMPLLWVVLFLPLAYWCRSRVIFGLGAIALALSFNLNLFWGNGIGMSSSWPRWLLGGWVFLCPALLWAFDRDMWQLSGVWRNRRLREKDPLSVTTPSGQANTESSTNQPIASTNQPIPNSQLPTTSTVSLEQNFQAIARNLSLILLSINLYILSFHGLWRDLIPGSSSPMASTGFLPQWSNGAWILCLDELLLLVAMLLGWIGLLKKFPGFQRFQLRALNSALVALLLGTPVFLYFYAQLLHPLPVVAPYLINIALALLAIGLIRDGLALSSRSFFWSGMVLLMIDIVTRMFEYNTGLMLKALAFVLCGIAVLLAGIWFERKSQRQLSSQKPPSQPLTTA